MCAAQQVGLSGRITPEVIGGKGIVKLPGLVNLGFKMDGVHLATFWKSRIKLNPASQLHQKNFCTASKMDKSGISHPPHL